MLKFFTESELHSLYKPRKGEFKIGDKVSILSNLNELSQVKSVFVFIGIEEDIGIRANLGIGGATTAWKYALKALLNMQSNSYLNGEELCLGGVLCFDDLMRESENLNPGNDRDLKRLRSMVSEIDAVISQSLKPVFDAGKIPLLIGGGHNNAYGIIKAFSKSSSNPLNILNIDPHTDFRLMEGRHSGNAFRYAKKEGILQKYAVFGLYPQYNSQYILDEFHQNSQLSYISFNTLLSSQLSDKLKYLNDLIHFLGTENCALEIDMDSLTAFPVSALNPSGFSLNEIRAFVSHISSLRHLHYIHICEASPQRAQSDLEIDLLGKSLAFILSDFIHTNLQG